MRSAAAAVAWLALVEGACAATLTVRSEPAGVIADTTTFHNVGEQVTTGLAVDRHDLGLLFSHWALTPAAQASACIGGRCIDPLGQALLRVTLAIAADTVATAYFLPVTQDDDQDGVPDGVEQRLFGNLDALATDDRDADGLTLADELAAGTSPVLPNIRFDGGLARAPDIALTLLLGSGSVFFREVSTPAGIVAFRRVFPLGSAVLTSEVPQDLGGWRFGWWAIDGLPQRDAAGLPLVRARVLLDTEKTAVAVYFDAATDIDADGLPDWMEYRWFGELGVDVDADPDNDGLSIADEVFRGSSPLLVERDQSGGVARSALLPLALDLTGAFRMLVTSSPAGIVAEASTPVAEGELYTSPTAPLLFTSQRFTCWMRDGNTVRDVAGMCIPGSVSLRMPAANVNLVATYLDAAADADNDGLPDWFETATTVATDLSLSDDPDGDGIAVGDEFLRGLSVTVAETQRHGGIARSSRGPTFSFRIFENGFESPGIIVARGRQTPM